jgi:hypothetical protein
MSNKRPYTKVKTDRPIIKYNDQVCRASQNPFQLLFSITIMKRFILAWKTSRNSRQKKL